MLSDFTPCELSYLATSFAVSISNGADNKTIRVLCGFFTDVIATLNLISSQRSFLNECRRDCEQRDFEHKD